MIDIVSSSRYSIDGRYLVITEDGVDKIFLSERRVFDSELLKNEEFTNHFFRDGDRVDQLAFNYGNDATKWWLIMEVNELVQWPLSIVPGVELKVPSQERFSSLG